jgi:hypothetical protein
VIRYDLIVKKIDGCASAKVEKHESGSFVKYVDVIKHIAELENVLRGVIDSCCLDEIDERVLVDVLAKGGAE